MEDVSYLRITSTWGLIMLTPGTPVIYLTIYQSENCALSDHTPWNSPVIWPTGEFRGVSCPGFLASFPAVNAALSFTQPKCHQSGFTAHGRADPSLVQWLPTYPALTLSQSGPWPLWCAQMCQWTVSWANIFSCSCLFLFNIQIAITYLPLNTMLLCDAYVE